jgi:DNA primase
VYNEPQEKILIRFLLMYGNEKLFESDEEQTGSEYISVAEYITNEILNDELEFNNLLYRQIFEEVHECIKRGEVIDIKYFVNHSNSQISKIAVDLLSFPYELSKLHKRKGANVETEEMLLKKNIPKAIIEYKRKILETVQKEKEEEIRKAQQDSAPEEQISKIMKQYITISSIITVMSKEKGWVVLK